jgi:hypothetical protein
MTESPSPLRMLLSRHTKRPRLHHAVRRCDSRMAARGGRAAAGEAADLGFLGPTAHSAANEWVAALAQRLRDVET